MGQRRERRTGRRRAGVAGDPEAETIARIAQPVHRLPVYELASEEALDLIHRASLELLSDVGIDFYHPEAESILTAHGVRYDNQMPTSTANSSPSTWPKRRAPSPSWPATRSATSSSVAST